MRPHARFTTRFAAITTVIAASLGCAQGTTQSGTHAATSAFSTTGAHVWPAASAGAVVESRTVSFALDRIDQRDLPLDNTFRRSGTGKDVTIYVFDGGLSTDHPELAGRVRRGFNAFPGDQPICNAHGTAVAGAAAGKTLGVAPDAEVVDVKMVECSRLRGTIDGIVRATAWVLDDARAHPERRAVANWSFIADTSAAIPALDAAVKALTEAGIPVLVSAGNFDMDACKVSPANSPGAIVVGASAVYYDQVLGRTLDRRAMGTAWGKCVDLYAPGDSVLLPSLKDDGTPITQLWNGTSMSTGYASGAAALILEREPWIDPDQLHEILKGNATKNALLATRDGRDNFLLYVGPDRAVETRIARR
jgi:subtilisin family serine protease